MQSTYICSLKFCGSLLVLCVIEYGMKWVIPNCPKVLSIAFYFYYDKFSDLYWIHSSMEILPGFTKETEKGHHSISSSRSGYLWFCKYWYDIKFLPNTASRIFHINISHKANSTLDHPGKCEETWASSEGTNSGTRSFLPMASCSSVFGASSDNTELCSLNMACKNITEYLQLFVQIKFHCNPT